MLDIGWSELLIIGVVALVVVGPKDLPKLLRVVGQSIAKIRRMASEFQGQVNEAIREAELEDVKKSVDDLRALNPANMIRNEIDDALAPIKSIGTDLNAEMARIEAGVAAPPAAADPAAAAADPAPPPAGPPVTAESLGLPDIGAPMPPVLPEPPPLPALADATPPGADLPTPPKSA
jgi:sec-independent protein translocase protein TatB